MTPAISLKNITVRGRLSRVNLDIAPGSLVGLVGPNGSGKSTLIQAAAGILPAQGGVIWNGKEIGGIPVLTRGKITAWVPQEARFEFGFTVESVVAQGRFAHGDDLSPEKNGTDKIGEAMRKMDLLELAGRPVNRLSSGERHRVILARALATGAILHLWDEPLSPLDPRHVLEVLKIARELAMNGATVLFSLHDLSLAHELDLVAVLQKGNLRAFGKPAEILTPPLLHDVFGVQSFFSERLTLKLS